MVYSVRFIPSQVRHLPAAKKPSRPRPQARLDLAQRLSIAAIWAMLFAGVWFEVFVSQLVATIGNYNFSIQEPVFVFIVAAASVAVVTNPTLSGIWVLPVLALNADFLFNLARGFALDPLAALTSLRSDGSFAPLLLMAACTRCTDRYVNAITRAIWLAALALLGLLVARTLIAPDLFMVADGLTVNEGRALSERGAIILAVAAGISLARFLERRHRRRWDLSYALLFFAGALFSRQGTATFCALSIFALTFGFNQGVFKSSRQNFFLIGVPLLTGALLLFNDSLTETLGRDYVERRLSNVQFRQEVWRAALQEFSQRGLSDKVFGVPFGEKLKVYTSFQWGTYEWVLSFHSMYIGILSHFGIAGSALSLIFIYGLAMRIAMKRFRKGAVLSLGLCIGLLVGALLLGYSYEIRNEGLILLMIPSIALNQRSRKKIPSLIRKKHSVITVCG
jgi:hypothetical protein